MRRALPALLCSTLLAACAGLGGSKPAASVPSLIAEPFCRGDYIAAAETLSASGAMNNANRFYAAYIADLSGHGARARPLYAEVAASGDRTPVSLDCSGKRTLPANEAAAGRLAAVAMELRGMDAAAAPPFQLHKGLPHTKPVRVAETSLPAAAQPAKPVATPKPASRSSTAPVELAAPASRNPAGRWFAHLTSYFSAEEAAGALAALGRRYPAVNGMFDTVQVVAKGRDAWRVGVRADDWADADRMCVAIRNAGDYCHVIDMAN